jgi:hypothetical protein
MASVAQVYMALSEWCDGGPTPNKEEVFEAFQYLIQMAPLETNDFKEIELAPNVIMFDPNYKV